MARPANVPQTLRAACRGEIHRVFTPPFETPIVVVFNGLLAVLSWRLLPTGLRDLLFKPSDALAFPLVIGSWMLADVPATNILGNDARLMGQVLGDERALRRLLVAKNLVLWMLVTIPCLILTAIVAHEHKLGLSVGLVVYALILGPIGTLSLAGLLGILAPYHPIGLRRRWEHRRPTRRMITRWAILVLLPYAYVPAVSKLLFAPVFHQCLLSGTCQTLKARHDPTLLAVAVLAIAAWALGHEASLRLIRRRRWKLAHFLRNPELG